MKRLITILILVAGGGVFLWWMVGEEADLSVDKMTTASTEKPELQGPDPVVKFEKLERMKGINVTRFPFVEKEKAGEIVVVKMKRDNFKASLKEDVVKPKFLKSWAEECEKCLVINGGYFMENYLAAGFLVVDGVRVNPEGLYDQNRSGMLVLNEGTAVLRDLAEEPIVVGLGQIENGLQSYPFLIKNGGAAISEDSGKTARRTALGSDKKGNLYVIFVDHPDLSLYRLMEELLATEIEFEHVLNLDGGPSSGMMTNFDGELTGFHSYSPVPNVVMFDFLNR